MSRYIIHGICGSILQFAAAILAWVPVIALAMWIAHRLHAPVSLVIVGELLVLTALGWWATRPGAAL